MLGQRDAETKCVRSRVGPTSDGVPRIRAAGPTDGWMPLPLLSLVILTLIYLPLGASRASQSHSSGNRRVATRSSLRTFIATEARAKRCGPSVKRAEGCAAAHGRGDALDQSAPVGLGA